MKEKVLNAGGKEKEWERGFRQKRLAGLSHRLDVGMRDRGMKATNSQALGWVGGGAIQRDGR